jgi:hypothetical protein
LAQFGLRHQLALICVKKLLWIGGGGDLELAAAEVELGRGVPGIPFEDAGFQGIDHVAAIAAGFDETGCFEDLQVV